MVTTIDGPQPGGAVRSAISSQPSTGAQAAALFEGLLFEAALAPVAKAMGFYGDLVVAEACRTIARGTS
jgi:hypothetical protein